MDTVLGFDIGSSSIKASLLDARDGSLIASASSPDTELAITALRPGWAEQDPELWWEHLLKATRIIATQSAKALASVRAIGISYQMHGLVCIDRDRRVLRPSIIWCDSRAVEIGEKGLKKIGEKRALSELLNSPGNFTASKLRWVQENEPDVYKRIWKFMLPGDYIALKLTGEVCTTPSGLSEGILWSFTKNEPATSVLDAYDISPDLLPTVHPTFSVQGQVISDAASELGIPPGTPVSYRAGDQPNNAFSLNVLNPGEFATTAGTSGVVYGVGSSPSFDLRSRVNTFVHVTHGNNSPRYGTLLCCNGTGILYSWLRRECSGAESYTSLNALAEKVPVGADGLHVFPYGNGAERSLGNRDIGASFEGINFNRHTRAHLVRAAQEGIVFSLQYGLEIMREIGIPVSTVRAGHANLFLSPLFREVFSAVTGASVELFDTDGAQGAARGAGVGAKIFTDFKNAFSGLKRLAAVSPDKSLQSQYQEIYRSWRQILDSKLDR